MAKVLFGAIVTDMRNKIGSQVYSRNKFGAYTRSFKATLASSTPDQVTVRNRLSSLSTAWRSLTEVQRNAWNSAVDSYKTTDVFGSVISPSGFDLYMRLNCNLLQVGAAQIDIPLPPGLLLPLSNVVVTADGTSSLVSIGFASSPVPAGYALVLSATDNISPGISYVKNLVRQIAIIDAGSASLYDASASYLAKFSTITNGKRLSISLVTVNKSTGQKSKPYYATCIIGSGIGLDFNQALDTGIPLG